MEIFLLFSFSFLRCYYMIDVTSCFSLVFSQMLKFWSCVRQMFHLDIWLVETVFEPAWILPCDMFVFIFIQFGIVNLYSMFVCSPSKSMRSRISFWQPEGRMPELLRSRRTRIWSSSRFAVPSTFTLCVSPTLRRLTSWNNHFLQVWACKTCEEGFTRFTELLVDGEFERTRIFVSFLQCLALWLD